MTFAARTADALVGYEQSTIAQAGIVDLIGGLILRTFPNTTLDAANTRDIRGPRGAAVRRALQYIEDNLGRPILVPEIADAARLSLRGLHAAFRRDLGTTPRAFIQAERLAAARHELRHSDPQTTSVTTIAVRWGFAHPAQFAERYRSTFGEPPDVTLQR